MITAIKSSNNDLYKALFEKASEILSGFKSVQTYENDQTYYYRDALTKSYIALVLDGETDNDKIMQFANALTEYNRLYIKIGDCVNGFVPELGITTLEEYYNWLPLLKSEGDKPTIFTKLPLDEPYFTINAETRAINIPADFKKNGIAVQGDDLAEVVYFMIDRYFDAVDLNNTEIFIEWETPKGKDGVATKSISEPYLKIIDDENYRGKLIFGWAISNAITANAGVLKFSVRFIDRDESSKKIEYMFNTLTAQVTIQPALGLELTDSVIQSADNCNERLLERITESVVVGGAQAAVPEFLIDLNDDDGFSYDIIPEANGEYRLQVVAKASDTGFISCIWKKAELDEYNNEKSWHEIPNSNTFEMIELTEAELTAFNYVLPYGRQYATSNGDGKYTDISVPKDGLNLITQYEEIDKIPAIYENRATLIVKDAGKYKAEARNRIFNSLTRQSSKVATFKRPDFVVLNNDNQTVEKHIIGEASATLIPVVIDAPGALSYQWYKADESNVLSSIVKYDNLPINTQISYGEESVAIMIPSDTNYSSQNVGEGGNPNSFYIAMKLYAPVGAVSFQEGECGLSGDVMPTLEPMRNIADAPHGVDSIGEYRIRWIPVASYDTSTKIWSYFGATKVVGWKYQIDWYDIKGNKLSSSFIKTKLHNEENYNNGLNDFEPISLATASAYEATEEGLYKLEVTRTRNNRTISADSIEYRVTNAPATPIFSIGTFDANEIVSVDDLEKGLKTLNISWENTKNDGYEINWYLSRELKGQEDLYLITQRVGKNVCTTSLNPTDSIFTETLNKAGEDVEAYYYATVKTKLNGVYSNTTEKPELEQMFSVTGA